MRKILKIYLLFSMSVFASKTLAANVFNLEGQWCESQKQCSLQITKAEKGFKISVDYASDDCAQGSYTGFVTENGHGRWKGSLVEKDIEDTHGEATIKLRKALKTGLFSNGPFIDVQIEGACLKLANGASFARKINLEINSQDAKEESASLVVGVLENVVTEGKNDETEPSGSQVRMLFKKNKNAWVPFKHSCDTLTCLSTITSEFPLAVNWTIAYDGKNVGELSTKAPYTFETYSRIGVVRLASTVKVPRIGKRTNDFSGFAGPGNVFRPLVIVSKPYFDNPDQWKQVTIDQKVLQRVFADFKKKNSKVKKCNAKGEPETKKWVFTINDLLDSTMYVSKNNEKLIKIGLKGLNADSDIGCDNFSPSWYSIDSNSKISFLRSDMILIDSGDYDHDGQSELIFQLNGYNFGGYRIYSDHFKKKADFDYTYH